MEGGKGEAEGVHDRMHRGLTVCLAFLMQGWGQIFNQLVLILLLLAFSGPNPPYGGFAAQWVFRLQFAFVMIATLFLAYVRYYHVQYPEDDISRARKKMKEAEASVAGNENLAPAILYHYIDNHTKFWVVTWFGLAGWVLTILFVPDTTGLDLREQERYWIFVAAGRAGDYHGVAVHKRHLSMWEWLILRRHKAYDAELDRQQRLEELVKEQMLEMEKELIESDSSEDCSSSL
jgi:hypothetical protein